MTTQRPTRDEPGPGIKLRKLKRPMVKDGRKITEVYDVVVTLPRDERGLYGKKWSRGHATLKDAIHTREELQVENRAGRIVRPGKKTVGEYLAEWIDAVQPTIKPSTWAAYNTHITKYLIPKLGSIRLNQLTTTHVRRIYADLVKEGRIGSSTVRRVHATLHRALADAVEDRLLTANPASIGHKKLPKAERYDYVTWDGEQLRVFLDHVADDRLYAAYHLAAFSGLRRGELLGLRWRDVGLANESISVNRALLALRHETSFSDVKSSHGVRVIDLDTGTVEVLKEHRKRQMRQMEERLAAGSAWRDDEGLVFTQPDGAIVHPDWFSKTFRARVKETNLPMVRLHDLRHGWATIAGKHGVPLKVIQERLGHHSPEFTLRQYVHVLPGMGRTAADTFANAIRSANGSEAAES